MPILLSLVTLVLMGAVEEASSFSPPVLTKFVQAKYPDEALTQGLEGEVILLLSVDETGHVTSATVKTEAGHGFDEAALGAARQFEFSPGTSEGRPVPVQITYRYKFVLKKPEEQPVNFEGRVLERGTRNAAPGVTVSFPDMKLEADTDAEGHFSMRGVPPGKHNVRIAGVDYYPFETEEDIRQGEVLSAKYYIRRRSYSQYETVVRGLMVEKEVTRRVLSLEEIKSTAGTSGDAIRVVEDLPGMARSPYIGGLLIVRGSAPQDTQVFADGHPIPLIYHFGGLTSTLSPEILSDIDFIPGGYSVRYGRGMGGIINVTTRSAKTDRWHGLAGMDIFDAQALVEGPVAGDGKGGFFLSARRSYIDAVLNAVVPKDVLTLTTAPRYYDYQSGFDYALERGHISALVFGSDDALALVTKKPLGRDLSLTGNFSTELYFHRILLSWEQRIGDRMTSEASFSFGVDNVDVSVGGLAYLNTFDIFYSLREELPMTIAPWLRLIPGVDVWWGPYAVKARVPPIPREGQVGTGLDPFTLSEFSLSGNFFAGAGFLEAQIEPVHGLVFIPGLRTDYYSIMELHKASFDPRLAIRWLLTEGLTAKGSVGVFHQLPDIPDLVPGYGNPDLGLQWDIQYTLGAEKSITDLISVDAQGFYKDMRHLVHSPSEVTTGGQILNNDGVGRAYGAEVLLRYAPGRQFYGWLAYTLSRSERYDPLTGSWRLFSFDQTHILTLIANYKLPRDWEAGIRFRYVTGNPTTPMGKGPYDSDRDRYLPIPGEETSQRMPSFNQLDVRIDKKFIYTTWILEVYLDLLNAYNEPNVEGYIYNFDYTKKTPLTGLPIIPSLGIQATF